MRYEATDVVIAVEEGPWPGPLGLEWDLPKSVTFECAPGHLSKTFATKPELDEFLAALGPLAFQSVRHGRGGMFTLSWRTLKLVCLDSGKRYEVKRETEHHYLIRDENGMMRAINRYTLIGYELRFKSE